MKNFMQKSRGASGFSYGLIVGLIAVVAISAVTNLGISVDTLMEDTADALEGSEGSNSGDTSGGSSGGSNNAAPVFDTTSPDVLEVDRNSGATSITTQLATSDADSGQTLSWTVATAPTNGSLTGFTTTDTSNGGSVTPSGLSYTPDPGYAGPDSFEVSVSDGAGGTALLTMRVRVAAAEFITTWNTANTGSIVTASNQIRLPLISSGSYNFYVDWGDSNNDTITTYSDPAITHTYASSGIYTVTITGNIDGWRFGEYNTSDASKITNISQWGSFRSGNADYVFADCNKLSVTATDMPDLNGITTMEHFFSSMTLLNSVPNMGNWDVSDVQDMSFFCYYCGINEDLGDWDVSNVTDMSSMFYNQRSFNQDISNWDTSNVNNMRAMFYNAEAFNQNIDGWDVSNVTDIAYMFSQTNQFNQPLNSWDTGKVENMDSVFYQAAKFNQPLDNWNTELVDGMAEMFYGANDFDQPIGSWDTGNVSSMRYMFTSNPSFDQNIGTWDVSSLTDASIMLHNSNLSVANYDALLNGWAAQTLQPNVGLSANGLNYSAAGAASRAILTSAPNNWSISGDSGP